MKKLLKIFFGILVLLILLMVLVPVLFKGKILNAVKQEIEAQVEAKVDFKDVSISLFRDFPSVSLELQELSVLGKNTFEGDTLLVMPALQISFDLSSVWSDDGYKVNRIALDSPQVNLLVSADGKENWDIAKSEGETPASQEAQDSKKAAEVPATTSAQGEESSSSLNLLLDDFEINNARIFYLDEASKVSAGVDGLDFRLKGDLSSQKTVLDLHAKINKLSAIVDGVPYLNQAKVNFKAGMDADLDNMIFTFKKNELSLNDLSLYFDGSVSMLPNDEINTVLTFETAETSFKSILSMVPAVYTDDFKDLKTSGNFSLKGSLNGIYKEEHYPAFNVKLNVNDGMFQYPDLPGAVTDINVDMKVSNPGGDLDKTLVDLSSFELKMAGNPLRASMKLTTPISDPDIDAQVNGSIDLDKLKDIIPLEENQKVNGYIKMDVSLKGKKSTIDEERYEDFVALGSVLVQRFAFTTPDLPEVKIENAQLNFAPAYLDLVSLKATIGSGDFSASGKIENYLAYALRDETIKARLNTKSNFINLNEFLSETPATPAEKTETSTDTAQKTEAAPAKEAPATAPAEETKLSVFKVPENIDFELNSTFNKLLYDKLELTNVNGKIIVKDGKVSLKPLKANLLDGQVSADGYYLTKDIPNARFAFNFDISKLDIQEAYNALSTLQELVPSAKHIQGNFSSKMMIAADMDAEMMPVYPTVNGYGQIQTSTLHIKGLPTLDKVADALKKDDLKDLTVNPTNLSFRIENGKVITTPFDIKSGDMKATISGTTSLDKAIDYSILFTFPRKDLGGDANNVLSGLVDLANNLGANFSLGETVSVAAKVTGTVDKPKVKLDLEKSLSGNSGSGSGGGVAGQAGAQAKEQLLKQADNIEAEAAKQAQQLIKSAQDGANQLRTEAKKKAAELIEEGKKKGWLGEQAAKAAADLVNKNADGAADELVKQAQNQAKNIKAKAKAEADKLRAKAK